MGKYDQKEESFKGNEEIERFIVHITSNKKDILKIINKNKEDYDYSVSSGGITFLRKDKEIGTIIIRRKSSDNRWISVHSHSYQKEDSSEISILYDKLKKNFNISEMNKRWGV